jgi:hypothetical protein
MDSSAMAQPIRVSVRRTHPSGQKLADHCRASLKMTLPSL